MGMPAVIIRHHGNRHVAKLGFPSQFGLLQVRHADDVHPQPAIYRGFGPGRELRSLHAYVGSLALTEGARLLAGALDDPRQLATYWVCKSNVRDHSAAEKCV